MVQSANEASVDLFVTYSDLGDIHVFAASSWLDVPCFSMCKSCRKPRLARVLTHRDLRQSPATYAVFVPVTGDPATADNAPFAATE